jgi:hypothetical protein
MWVKLPPLAALVLVPEHQPDAARTAGGARH